MKSILLSTAITVITIVRLAAQGGGPADNPSSVPSLASVMPGSPNSASLGKFGDYKVSMFTGLADINIPIYTIKSSRLELPIQLKYHP
ncbi:MAG TPA: hypothetical protein VK543_18760 [Puia sp.]|nr:hypothetical protein [Puia sp.]